MAKQKKLKRAASTALAPADAPAADIMLARIGDLVRKRDAIQAGLDARVTEARQIADAQAAPLAAEIDTLTRGLQLWAEGNREKLTDGFKRKTVTLAAGELLWRIRPPSVRITGEADVIAYLRTAELNDFLRNKVSIDKEAMLQRPALARTVPGVAIGSEGEEFVVVPVTLPLSGQGGVA